MNVTTICLHGTKADDEGNPGATYAEPKEATGWCVYTRTDTAEAGEDDGEFDISDETDFSSFEEAHEEAGRRSEKHGVDVEIY